MRIRAGIVGLGVMLLAPGAWACPAGSLQGVVDLFIAARQPGADLAKISASVDAKAGACLTDPMVLRAAVVAADQVAGKATGAEQKLAYREAAFRWYTRMLVAYTDINTPTQTVTTPEGPVLFGMGGAYDLGKPLLTGLFEAETAAGKLSGLTAKAGAGASAGACTDYPMTAMLEAQQFIRMRGDHDGAFGLVDRGVAACGNDKFIDNRLALRARVMVISATRKPAPADAEVKLKQARADADKYLALSGGKFSTAYWREDENRQLNNLLSAAGAVIEANWFAPGNETRPEVVAAIALKLEAAWAASEAAGGIAAGYQAWRTAIAPLNARAMQAANPDAARRGLAMAARGVSDGTMRSAANKGLPPVPGFLWVWIHPEVK